MACSHSSRVVLKGNLLALALIAVVLAVPAKGHASSPDISRLQADAERGFVKQEIQLGAAYFTGQGVNRDEKRAAYWYEKAANAGDPGAQFEIGSFYQAGVGVERNPVQAVRWFQRSAAGGSVSAKVNLGAAYLLGDGVRKDPVLAEELFREAYAKKDGHAACDLGDMYYHGMGVAPDELAAEHWYEAGAKLHNPQAAFRLATLLWERHRDHSEVKRAVSLYRQSSEEGMVAAKHQLAVVLLKRPDLAIAKQEVLTLLKESAQAGEWRSSMALGFLSRDGKSGMPVDLKQAYYHYRLAVLQGGDAARKIVANDLEAIAGKLGADQAAAIDTEAGAWFQAHHDVQRFIHQEGLKSKEHPAYAIANPHDSFNTTRIPSDLLWDSLRGAAVREPLAQ